MAVIDTTKPQKPTKRPAKLKVIEEVKSLLESSSIVFSVPSSYIKANQVVALRKDLPEGCTAKVVKNKLMRIACEGSEFAQLAEVSTGENFWMFVEGEENLSEPIKYVAEFAKQFDKDTVSQEEESVTLRIRTVGVSVVAPSLVNVKRRVSFLPFDPCVAVKG